MRTKLSAELLMDRSGPEQLDVCVRREATFDLFQEGSEMLVPPAVGCALEVAAAAVANRRVMADVAGRTRA